MSTEVFIYFHVFKLLLHVCHLTIFYLNIKVITVGGLKFPVVSAVGTTRAKHETFHMVNNDMCVTRSTIIIFLLTDHIRST